MSGRLETHEEILNVSRNHYRKGNIPSPWLYADMYMDRRISREMKSKKHFLNWE
jgi:hypothetical protein